jgi:endoglucanase
VQDLSEGFEAEGGSLNQVLLALTRQGHFTQRQGEGQEQDIPYGQPAPLYPSAPPEDHIDPDSGGLDVEVQEQSRWQSGYCVRVYVTNTNEEPTEWSVSIFVEGTIYNAWSSQRDGDSGDVIFSGEGYNSTLAPGARAEFGFCANL